MVGGRAALWREAFKWGVVESAVEELTDLGQKIAFVHASLSPLSI